MIIQIVKKHIKGCQMPTRRCKLKPQCDSITHLPECLMKKISKKTASVGWDVTHHSFHSDIFPSQIKPNEGEIFF